MTTTEHPQASDRILRIIRGLLDKADNAAATPAEAETARAKAEELMAKYRVEQEETLARDPQTFKPELRSIVISTMDIEFYNKHYALWARIATHVGIMFKHVWVYNEDTRTHDLVARAVGYDFDLKLAELLFTSALMVFSEHLEPKPLPHLSDQVNVYRMRKAGMERNKVASIMWGAGPKDGVAHGKVAKLYKAECAARGEDPALSGRGVSAKDYRAAYADGFVIQMGNRLRKAREGADKGAGLPDLSGREDRVREAFYEQFPEERPVPAEARAAVAQQGGKKRKEREYKWTQADERRWQRQNSGVAAVGRAAGRTAADDVRLDGSAPAPRLDDRTGDERAVTRAIEGLLP